MLSDCLNWMVSCLAVFTNIKGVSTRRVAASLLFFLILCLCVATFSPPGEKLVRDMLMTTVSPFTTPRTG